LNVSEVMHLGVDGVHVSEPEVRRRSRRRVRRVRKLKLAASFITNLSIPLS